MKNDLVISAVLWAAIITTVIVWETARISFTLALAIVVGVVLALGACIIWARRLWKRYRPCAHGVWAGLGGRCEFCQAEAARILQESKARTLEWERRKSLERKAKELQQRERERLSRAWLANTEAYFQMTPQQFENAIAELFRKLGYRVWQTPFSNDGGNDAVAFKDGKSYLIECKRYDAIRSVGRRDIQILVAAMQDEKATAGFYLNTGTFTKDAVEYAAKHGIALYDRLLLPHLVNKAYPASADISAANTMCLECGSVIWMPVCDSPSNGTCANGHLLTNNITWAHVRVVAPNGAPLCDRCGFPMRTVNGYRGKFW